MLTIKSDDVFGRAAAFEAIIRGEEIKKPNVPASFNVLVSELKALGLAVNYEYEGVTDQFSEWQDKEAAKDIPKTDSIPEESVDRESESGSQE
jgi:hypothetical protein